MVPSRREQLVDWVAIPGPERMGIAMGVLVELYHYPVPGAAGIVGNLWAESEVVPNRIEGSETATPMRAPDFDGVPRTFTLRDVMDRDPSRRRGPRQPGVGLAQWTRRDRREGLFRHVFQGRAPGAAILLDMHAQIDYLVTELRSRFRSTDLVLRHGGVSLEAATEEVVYNFQIPGSILGPKPAGPGRRRLARGHPAVIEECARRRHWSGSALRAYGWG